MFARAASNHEAEAAVLVPACTPRQVRVEKLAECWSPSTTTMMDSPGHKRGRGDSAEYTYGAGAGSSSAATPNFGGRLNHAGASSAASHQSFVSSMATPSGGQLSSSMLGTAASAHHGAYTHSSALVSSGIGNMTMGFGPTSSSIVAAGGANSILGASSLALSSVNGRVCTVPSHGRLEALVKQTELLRRLDADAHEVVKIEMQEQIDRLVGHVDQLTRALAASTESSKSSATAGSSTGGSAPSTNTASAAAQPSKSASAAATVDDEAIDLISDDEDAGAAAAPAASSAGAGAASSSSSASATRPSDEITPENAVAQAYRYRDEATALRSQMASLTGQLADTKSSYKQAVKRLEAELAQRQTEAAEAAGQVLQLQRAIQDTGMTVPPPAGGLLQPSPVGRTAGGTPFGGLQLQPSTSLFGSAAASSASASGPMFGSGFGGAASTTSGSINLFGFGQLQSSSSSPSSTFMTSAASTTSSSVAPTSGDLHSTIKRLESEVASAREQLRASQRKERSMADELQRLQSRKSNESLLTEQIATMQTKLHRLEAAAADASVLKTRLQASVAALQMWQREVFRPLVSSAAATSASAASSSTSLALTDGEIDVASSSDAVTSFISACTTQASAVSSAVRELQGNNTMLLSTVAECRAHVDSCMHGRAGLEGRMRDLAERLAASENQRADADDRAFKLSHQLQIATDQRDRLASLVRSYETEDRAASAVRLASASQHTLTQLLAAAAAAVSSPSTTGPAAGPKGGRHQQHHQQQQQLAQVAAAAAKAAQDAAAAVTAAQQQAASATERAGQLEKQVADAEQRYASLMASIAGELQSDASAGHPPLLASSQAAGALAAAESRATIAAADSDALRSELQSLYSAQARLVGSGGGQPLSSVASTSSSSSSSGGAAVVGPPTDSIELQPSGLSEWQAGANGPSWPSSFAAVAASAAGAGPAGGEALPSSAVQHQVARPYRVLHLISNPTTTAVQNYESKRTQLIDTLKGECEALRGQLSGAGRQIGVLTAALAQVQAQVQQQQANIAAAAISYPAASPMQPSMLATPSTPAHHTGAGAGHVTTMMGQGLGASSISVFGASAIGGGGANNTTSALGGGGGLSASEKEDFNKLR